MSAGQQKKVGVVDVQKFELVPRFGDFRSKKQRKEPGSKSVWKFYQAMLFLKPTLEKACDKSEEWPEEEKRSLINFYNQNHELWNHKLRDYHDKAKRKVLLAKLMEELENKYTDKEIVATWYHLKTHYDRELLREKGSKPSGTSTSHAYHSSWKFFQEMSFVADANTEPDTARSTLGQTGRSPASSSDGTEDTPATSYQQPWRKQKVTTTDEESTAKRNLMYDAAIQFMQQPPPPPPQPKGDEDLLGEYVASQLKLITDLKQTFHKGKNQQLTSDATPTNAAPIAQVNNQFLSQDFGPYF